MAKISESTPITIGLVIVLLGGVAWLSTLYAKTESNSQSIEQLTSSNNSFQRDVIQRLTRLEAMLEQRSRRTER